MFIPAKEFMKVRQEDYILLKSIAKPYTFNLKGEEFYVNQLLTINYNRLGNSCIQDVEQHTYLCNILTQYADGLDYDCYSDIKDKEWYDHSITNLCNGFNHIKNYIELQKITTYKKLPINIVDSFLCLSLEDGRYRHCKYDTVDEMMKSLYCP
jgi:hypothetical protein